MHESRQSPLGRSRDRGGGRRARGRQTRAWTTRSSCVLPNHCGPSRGFAAAPCRLPSVGHERQRSRCLCRHRLRNIAGYHPGQSLTYRSVSVKRQTSPAPVRGGSWSDRIHGPLVGERTIHRTCLRPSNVATLAPLPSRGGQLGDRSRETRSWRTLALPRCGQGRLTLTHWSVRLPPRQVSALSLEERK